MYNTNTVQETCICSGLSCVQHQHCTENMHLQRFVMCKAPAEIKSDCRALNIVGNSLTSSNSLDKEVSNCIAKASACYGRLHKRVWNERGLKLETMCEVYRAVVLTVLLYGCESWTLYRRHVTLLDQFHPALPPTYPKHQMVLQCLKREGTLASSDAKYRCTANTVSAGSGHLVRMQDNRLPKQLVYSELTEGHRPNGWSKLRYKDTLEKKIPRNATLIKKQTNPKTMGNHSHKQVWMEACYSQGNRSLRCKQSSQQKKHAAMKARTIPAERSTECPECSRLCASDFGLKSRVGAHKQTKC